MSKASKEEVAYFYPNPKKSSKKEIEKKSLQKKLQRGVSELSERSPSYFKVFDEDDDSDQLLLQTEVSVNYKLVTIKNLAKDVITERYNFEKPLGEGGFGSVKVASLKKDPRKKYAIKSIKKEEFRSASEMRMVLQMDHPNIAKIYKCVYDKFYVHFVMKYIDGITLKDYMERFPARRLPETKCQIIMRQLINAIKYMHSVNIAHRDLKLHNIMVTNYENEDERDLRVHVIDFGLSKFFKDAKSNQKMEMKSFTGTELFMAPEIM